MIKMSSEKTKSPILLDSWGTDEKNVMLMSHERIEIKALKLAKTCKMHRKTVTD